MLQLNHEDAHHITFAQAGDIRDVPDVSGNSNCGSSKFKDMSLV